MQLFAHKKISEQGSFGPATVILEGVSVGLHSTAAPIIILALAVLGSYSFSGGFKLPEMGLYGIGFGAVGMLATLGVTLAMDSFGPIADNAGGNAQMSNLPKEVRERTDALDSVGNTTAATGKGFAIGSAALTAMALLAAYLEEIRNSLMLVGHKIIEIPYAPALLEAVNVSKISITQFMSLYKINVMNPRFLIGLFMGLWLLSPFHL